MQSLHEGQQGIRQSKVSETIGKDVHASRGIKPGYILDTQKISLSSMSRRQRCGFTRKSQVAISRCCYIHNILAINGNRDVVEFLLMKINQQS